MLKQLAPILVPLMAITANAQLVINEVDFDQPGTDNAEYIEVLNTGASVLDLSNLTVVLYNGASGTGVQYASLSGAAWPVLPPGGFFVICGNAGTPNCNAVVTPATNLIQNGPSDAVVLVWTENPIPVVMDALSYAGTLTGFAEGTGASQEDSNLATGISIGRFPDGTDTNDNNADFHRMCSTPGAANVIDPQLCDLDIGISRINSSGGGFQVLLSPGGEHVMLFDANAAGEEVLFEVFNAQGSMLFQHRSGAAPRASWSFPTGGIDSGVLLLRLSTPTRRETRKVALL